MNRRDLLNLATLSTLPEKYHHCRSWKRRKMGRKLVPKAAEITQKKDLLSLTWNSDFIVVLEKNSFSTECPMRLLTNAKNKNTEGQSRVLWGSSPPMSVRDLLNIAALSTLPGKYPHCRSWKRWTKGRELVPKTVETHTRHSHRRKVFHPWRGWRETQTLSWLLRRFEEWTSAENRGKSRQIWHHYSSAKEECRAVAELYGAFCSGSGRKVQVLFGASRIPVSSMSLNVATRGVWQGRNTVPFAGNWKLSCRANINLDGGSTAYHSRMRGAHPTEIGQLVMALTTSLFVSFHLVYVLDERMPASTGHAYTCRSNQPHPEFHHLLSSVIGPGARGM